MKTVLFLCTGNYYRSRFAEELFNFLAPETCPGWTAASRGVAVDLGGGNVGPIARATEQALCGLGLAFDRQTARFPLQVAVEDLDAADHIVALKQAEHLPLMQARFAAWVAASARKSRILARPRHRLRPAARRPAPDRGACARVAEEAGKLELS